MRFFLGIVISLGFIVGGVVPIVGGFSMMSRQVTGDDVLFAFTLGGLLMLIGVVMFWAVLRARRKRRDIDAGALTGTATGMMLGSGDVDDFSDDFSD